MPLSRTYTSIWYNNFELEIDPISIEPGETTNCDIHFISVSINNIERKNIVFSLFPNPAKENVQFYYKTEFQDDRKMRIEIRSLDGKLVDKINLQKIGESFVTYSLENKNKGLYICSLMSDNVKLREVKLIIQ